MARHDSNFPIILMPPEIQQIQADLPTTPTFNASPPILSEVEPQPINFFPLFIAIALLIVGTSFIYGFSKNAGTIVLLVGLGVIFLDLHLRLKSYQYRLQKYNRILAGYFTSLETYARKQAQHETGITLATTPERLRDFRQSQLLEFLRRATYGPQGHKIDNYILNIKQKDFASELAKYFPNSIHMGWQVELSNRSLTLDFAYVDPQTNLHIAIAVDDQSHEPTEIFDRSLLNSGWIVIRFSASQAERSPDSCSKAIAIVIDDLLGDRELIHKFNTIQDL